MVFAACAPRLSFLCFALSAAILLFVIQANAQLDPSSVLFFDGESSTTGGAAIDTGRYTIRPKTDSAVKTKVKPKTTSTPAKVEAVESVGVTKNSESIPPVDDARSNVTPAVKVQEANSGSAKDPQPPRSAVKPTVVPLESSPSTTVRESVNPSLVSANHILDLSVSTGYMYNDSSSLYSFRNYQVATPIVATEASVWFDSEYGVHGSYLSTYNASVNDSYNGTRSVPLTQTWLNLGLRYKKSFATKEKPAATLLLGLDYVNFTQHVSTDAKIREGLVTSGGQISVDAELPTSALYTLTLGIKLAPLQFHNESATGVSFQSGSGVNSMALGFSIGSRFKLSPSDEIFFKLSETIERDVFTGTANLSDPVTGVSPSDVSVTNSFLILQLGYIWGN